MAEYKEIFKLKEKLEEAKIPFEFSKLFDGYHLCYPEQNTDEKEDVRVCSVIEHYGSYGHSEDLLEIMGLLTEEEYLNDEVVGHLSADEVFQRIKKHYEENTKAEPVKEESTKESIKGDRKMITNIQHVAVPLVYAGEYNPEIDNEVAKANKIIGDRLAEGYTILATHTMTVNQIGYLVYVMIKEA